MGKNIDIIQIDHQKYNILNKLMLVFAKLSYSLPSKNGFDITFHLVTYDIKKSKMGQSCNQ